MGFKSTRYSTRVNTIADSFKGMLNNPYYLWTNNSGTSCTYYLLNKKLSMLDKGFRFEWSAEGDYSAFKYDKILDFMVFGLDQIQLGIEQTDFGPEASNIEGDVIILPNTIEPCPGDFFTINYHDMDLMFQIIDVQPDTLENGSNMFRVTYHLSRFGKDELNKFNIANVYHFIIDNVGTSLGTLVSDENYQLIDKYEAAVAKLREYYIAVFNSNRVQSLIFADDRGFRYYDPYMIEFCKRNNLLVSYDQNYFLQHMIDPGVMFPITYNRTIFAAIEEKNLDKVKHCIKEGYGLYINSKTSIFGTRYEDYYQVMYDECLALMKSDMKIEMFDTDFFIRIENNKLYNMDNKLLYDIVIKYMNDIDLSDDDFMHLEYIPFYNSAELFYAIPIALYCLNKAIEKLLS